MIKRIGFIVPYFGKLPEYFQVWLDSCKTNPTIDWFLFTNDKAIFDYPANVKVEYTTLENIKSLINEQYDFEINLSRPYKLCDYKIAYGEIFNKYLKGYDFWGFCDIDIIWGNIRKFFNNELLDFYDKIGVQGHCTIFKNTCDINSVYRNKIDGFESIQTYFQREDINCLDKNYISKEFEYAGLKIYEETIYAGLHKYFPGFYLQGLGDEEDEYSRHNLFLWDNGTLTRYYFKENKLVSKEYLYIHFFCRPMKNLISKMDRILIWPDCYKSFYDEIDEHLVRTFGKKAKIAYYFRVFIQNRKKLSIGRLINFIKMKHNYKYIR